MPPAPQPVPRGNVADGISAEFQTLRDRSTVHYAEDEVLRRPFAYALAGAGLALVIASIFRWGSARLGSTSFDFGRVLAGLGGLFAIAGAYAGVYNEQRRVGAWAAIGAGGIALVLMVFAAREARIGYFFILAFIATIAIITIGVVSLFDAAAEPPQRRLDEE